ncbi:DNA polymerase, partial [bacterium]|nr:DNA polymerase [bacterium]
MSGRQFMHLANCQGHINDATLIGAITARVIRVRNLGSTAANADLELPNEIEFSISANVGVTYREDIEPRTRRITLAYYDEDANKREFHHLDLHAHVRDNRGPILGAVDALVAEWVNRGMPDGTTPFTSFPEWAKIVGGIMQINGLGDPCLPHESELELGGDLKERAMRVVYRIGGAEWPSKWVTKEALFKVLSEIDDEDLLWFGPWSGDEARGTRNKVGMALKAYNKRVIGDIRLDIDQNGKGAQQKICFTPEGCGGTHQNGNSGNPGNLLPDNPPANQKPNTMMPTDIALPWRNPAVKVSQVSQVSSSPYNLVSDVEELTMVATALSKASAVALDTETYGPGKDGALNPRKGRIRLLQLCLPGEVPWVIDIKQIGTDLGPLKRELESIEVIAHNARFDLGFLREQLEIAPVRVYCTMTASQLLTAGSKDKNDLFSCLDRYLGVPPYADESRSNWSEKLTGSQFAYAASDVLNLHDLRKALREQLDNAGLTYVADLEMALVPVVVDIESAGLLIDSDGLRHQIEKAGQITEQSKEELRRLSGRFDLNPNSHAQVKKVLREQGLDLPDTRQETLAAYTGYEVVAMLLQFRQKAKLTSMLKKLEKEVDPDGRLRASFNPMGTCTGRFSSKGPNLQNI